jgi:hypothetical protein
VHGGADPQTTADYVLKGQLGVWQDALGGQGDDPTHRGLAKSSEPSRSLTWSAGKTSLPSLSAIQTETAPLPNINFAPRRASSIVAQGGLLTGTPAFADWVTK